jgi:hypothetical protein
MNDTGGITQPSSIPEDDQLQRRLQNVFRVLAKPDHERREQALQLRQEVSSEWRILAHQGTWFPWPTTVAPPGARKLKGVRWWQGGILGFLGYHVGERQPTRRDIRWRILEYVFECHLPPLNGLDYYVEWAEPRTPQRLQKLADTLASFSRNAKRQDALSYATAITDWEDDLIFLRKKYYVDFFHFEWPATDC